MGLLKKNENKTNDPPITDRSSMFGGASHSAPVVDPKPEKSNTVSDVMSRRNLEMKKLSGEVRKIELHNAQVEGEVVSRKIMIVGVWNPLETFLYRILSDGCRTASKTLYNLGKAGGSKEEFEVALRGELSSFIVPFKESIRDALKVKDAAD